MTNLNTTTPRHVREALARIGRRIELFETAALFTDMHADATAQSLVSRDVRYGPDERNVLDVFVPSVVSDRPRPLVVFVPGGGFTQGGKRPGELIPGVPTYFYDNVARWVATQGMVGVVADYRLAPAHGFPAGVEDLEALIMWASNEAVHFGVDPGSVFLWGHSAGAAHVADFVAARWQDHPRTLRGAILTSGFYVLPDDRVSEWHAYYGRDVARYKERSSLPGLTRCEVPLLVTDAELDPEPFKLQAQRLESACKQRGKAVQRAHVPFHSHLSEIFAIGTSDDSLTGPVSRFVRANHQRS